MTGHSPWDELAVGFALGALEPEDEETFAGHLHGCTECTQTVADVEATSAELAYAVPGDEPPPALLQAIMAEVKASGRPKTPLSAAVPDLAKVRSRRRTDSGERRPAGRWNAAWLGRAAALVLVLALAGWNYQLRLDNSVKDTSLGNAAEFGRLLTTPGAQTVDLVGKGKERGKVVVQGESAYLLVDDFARNEDEDSIYVLWAQNKGSDVMYDVGAFKVVHDRPTYIPVRELTDSGQIGAFAVSKEKGTVVPKLPSEPIAVGKTSGQS